MKREELIKELLRMTGIPEKTLQAMKTDELENIYAERVLVKGML